MSDTKQKFGSLKATYNYCQVCGHTPETEENPNRVARWWDPDDGWRFGALCGYCHEETLDSKPSEGDYALEREDKGFRLSNIDTEEDILDLL